MTGIRRYSLVLSVKRGQWRNKGGTEPTDKDYQRIRPSVFAKDGNTCVFCELTLSKGLEVHHKNDNHADNSISNLVSSCRLCHAVHHIGFLAKSGVMCHIPDISMTDLNHLCRSIAIAAISKDGDTAAIAALIEGVLMESANSFYTTWGTKNPADIGNALLALPDEAYLSRENVLEGARVVFHSKMLKTWAEGVSAVAYSSLPTSEWDGVAAQYLTESADEWESAGKLCETDYEGSKKRGGGSAQIG